MTGHIEKGCILIRASVKITTIIELKVHLHRYKSCCAKHHTVFLIMILCNSSDNEKMRLVSNTLNSDSQIQAWRNYPWWRHQMEAFSALLSICGGIHRSPVNSPHKSQWRGDLTFSLICARMNGWVTNREAGDLRGQRAHYDVTVMPNE